MTALEALGWVVIHSTWQAGAVAAALAMFLRVGRVPPRQRYVAAFGALLATVALPALTAALLVLGTAGAADGLAGTGAGSDAALVELSVLASLHAAIAPAATWVALAWLTGVVLLFARWAGGWWLITRLASRATCPARPAWTESLRAMAARLRVTSPVELRESTAVDSPTLLGHRRPIVVVPVPAFEALSSAEAASVIAHELAHVRRRDFAANGVQGVVEILFFFHPAVHWISRATAEARELCCDDVAVRAAGSRAVYASALARLEALRGPTRARRLALGADGGELLHRIRRLAEDADPAESDGPSPRFAAVVTLTAALACVAALGSLVLPPTVDALSAARGLPDRYTVRAQDPAGEFSITFERGRPAGAIIDGVVVGRAQLVTRGDSLYLPWGRAGSFAVRLRRGGFTWAPRRLNSRSQVLLPGS